MSDYDELARKLRNRRIALQAGLSGEDFPLLMEAADAIDDLQSQLSVYEEGTKVRFLKNDDGTEELRLENQWIPVTERLPEEGVSVQVCFHSQGGKFQAVSERFVDNCNQSYWSGLCGMKPTHWKPLPEPPKEES